MHMGAGGAFHTETVRANPNLRGMETLFGSRGGAEKARDTHAALKVGRAKAAGLRRKTSTVRPHLSHMSPTRGVSSASHASTRFGLSSITCRQWRYATTALAPQQPLPFLPCLVS
jgi:hypothetical protein